MKQLITILLISFASLANAQTVKVRVMDSFSGSTGWHGALVSSLIEKIMISNLAIKKYSYNLELSHLDVMREVSKDEVVKYNLQSYPKNIITNTVRTNRFLNSLIKAGEEKVRIINYSVTSVENSPSQQEGDAIVAILEKYDMILVTAAGNDGVQADRYPCSYNSPRIVCVSAGYVSYVLKGLGNEGIVLEKYSNISLQTLFVSYGQAGQRHGTSFATPRVTAMLAFLMSNHPHLSSMQVISKLEKYGHFVDSIDVTDRWAKETVALRF